MDCIKLDFKDTGLFSKLLLDYIDADLNVQPFYSARPTLEGFKDAIEAKSFSKNNRETLVEVLKDQYRSIDVPEKVNSNIDSLLSEKTFTVTTGHQLNIFTGPLFYIYKLVATINITKKLNEKYPEYHFVPVYWMGSEDHDFEEINHLYIDGKRYEWQSDQQGATGRFSTEGLEEVLDQLPGRTKVFKEALKRHSRLSDVVRDYVNALLGKEGLVIIDADDARFKKEFLHVIEDELFEESSYALVEKQSLALDEAGYKQQLHPRELNLFYLDDGLRSRLIKEEDGFSVLDTELHFTKEEIRSLLKTNPEKFSPNVILRPVFQETILPNLAYVGGPSELAYWFQLKLVFDHYNLAFPILMPRSFIMYIGMNTCHKIQKLDVNFHDLFLRKDLFINKHIRAHSNGELDLESTKEELNLLYEKLMGKAASVDSTLGPLVESEQVKANKSVVRIEQKMIRAEKRKREDELRMLEEIYDSLYPSGIPHERRENLLAIDDPNFIEQLLELLSPLELKYGVIRANK
ncbi:MAG: bacillithiol biosynthesis cysteine-adding enzyme BshC [Cyclobacteriaceae bacterium]|nr:bacillithiol biosynthesis cysteine-adding enzyme BshC [Cyclobacteriaceae bacterium]